MKGGTPYGITMALEVAYGCPFRAWLGQRSDVQGRETTQMSTGTVCHAVLERFYSDPGFDWDVAGVVEELGGENRVANARATTIMQRYRASRSPTEFGKVLGVEVDLAPEELDPAAREAFYTKGSPTGEAPKGVFPIRPYSGRVDLVCKVGKKQAAKLSEIAGDTIEPGVWLVDHKIVEHFDAISTQRYEWSQQATAYVLAYGLLNPKNPPLGLIFNITAWKKNQTHLVVRRPSKIDLAVLKETGRRLRDGGYWPLTPDLQPPHNPERCLDYYNVCWAYRSCQCLRA